MKAKLMMHQSLEMPVPQFPVHSGQLNITDYKETQMQTQMHSHVVEFLSAVFARFNVTFYVLP